MILGVDHVAVTSQDVVRDAKAWAGAGYRIRFMETEVPNLAIKRPLMTSWQAKHDLALLEHDSALPVELIAHGPDTGHQGFLRADDALPQPLSVLASLTHVPKSSQFWRNLGFQPDGNGWTLHPPIGRPLRITARPVQTMPRPQLDDQGMHALALVTSSVKAERARLRDAGWSVTDIESIHVGGQEKHVFFVQGPSGEAVEMIGIRL